MEFSVLASSSRANCIYVKAGDTAVLIDCGLSARETGRRLNAIGVDPRAISAVILSHEHSDHIAGLRVFSRTYPVKVFGNAKTLAACRDWVNGGASAFENGEAFVVGDLRFEPFSVNHDAFDPVAFRINFQDTSLAVVTDLGEVTNLVRNCLQELDGLVIEANHDPELLMEAPYPWELKQRIKGRMGHLSNEAAAELLTELGEKSGEKLKVVVAAHLSEKSNHPSLVSEVLSGAWEKSRNPFWPDIVISSPYQPTKLFQLDAVLQSAAAELVNQ